MPEIVVNKGASGDIIDIHRYSLDQFTLKFTRIGRGAAWTFATDPRPNLSHHKIFYSFDGMTVLVVRILHHAMNAAARLTDR